MKFETSLSNKMNDPVSKQPEIKPKPGQTKPGTGQTRLGLVRIDKARQTRLGQANSP